MMRIVFVLGMVGLLIAASDAAAAPRGAGWPNFRNIGNGGSPYIAPNLKEIGEGGLKNSLPNVKTIGEGGVNNVFPNRRFARGPVEKYPNLRDIGSGGGQNAFPRLR